jgi:hypothetical protein
MPGQTTSSNCRLFTIIGKACDGIDIRKYSQISRGVRMGSFRDNIYMITSPARSGSTMLVHLLRSHPEICSHGEVFSPQKITGITGTYLQKSRQQPDFIDRLSAERNRDPIKFLYKIALDLQGKKAVCFKLKHDELSLPEYKTLRDEIVNDTDFRIIHLRREDLLRRYLSHYIVNHFTHVTMAVHGQVVPEMPRVGARSTGMSERL